MDIISAAGRPGHRRNKSASVLRAIIPSKGLKRSPSDEKRPSQQPLKENTSFYDPFAATGAPILPPNHPHAGQRVLGEITPNSSTPSSRRPTGAGERPKALHKKTLSSVSLRSMANEKDESPKKGKSKSSKSSARPKEEKDATKKPKKSKSSTSLASVFSKGKSSKGDTNSQEQGKDKENTTPPNSSGLAPHTPIWAQFATTSVHEISSTTKVPLNDRRTVDEEIALYMPSDYSPSKQRNFHGYAQPTLGRRERPKSEVLIGNGSTTSLFDVLSRKISNDGPSNRRKSLIGSRRNSSEDQNERTSTDKSNTTRPTATSPSAKATISVAKRGSRVRAAVAAINNRTKEAEKEKLDPKEIDAAFEAVLDSRNIPENMRKQMRSLTTRVKADFIKADQFEPPHARSHSSSSEASSGSNDAQPARQAGVEEPKHAAQTDTTAENTKSTKRSRPRSKTFTFSKSDKSDSSPVKKQKSEAGPESKRSSKVLETPMSPAASSLSKPTGSSFFGRSQKPAAPEEYVSYLRKNQNPKEAEVGKLHKLRLLLRNETVQWVVNFIKLGGMNEIVALLHRIMEVEWREDHEDQLLHETLLCLKALCTTDLALQKLCEIEKTLFPALLGMIFDPEHKGPSEFTTRQIIMNILLSHLTAAFTVPDILPFRAQTILGYLADPEPEDGKKPVEFVLEMRQKRPYKIWCRELSNVTKEVFWIFLHHLNVIALPPIPTSDTTGSLTSMPPSAKQTSTPLELEAETYAKAFFPSQRAPVPAAPYVGGVEWDATNYLAAHLDLLNAILASLPTRAERNILRQELQASGFEKVMGGMLRTCKEKFYGAVHDGLRTWVAAGAADGWDVRDVRMGPREDVTKSPRKSPQKKKDLPPKLEAPPKLDLGLGLEKNSAGIGKGVVDDWI